MSDLVAMCGSLLATCAEAGVTARDVLAFRKRIQALAAEVTTVMRGADGSASHTARMLVADLERADRACLAVARQLQHTAQQGRAYITARLAPSGGRRSTPGHRPFPGFPEEHDTLPQQASKSEWWPPAEIPDSTFDHILSGDLRARVEDGRWRAEVTGFHYQDPTAEPLLNAPGLADRDEHEPHDVPGRSVVFDPEHYAALVEMFELSGVDTAPGVPFKKAGSTVFPKSWSKEKTQAAVREAWTDPNGTRQWNSAGGYGVGGRWSGVSGGLRIKGFFHPGSGECISAWPAPNQQNST